MKNPIVCEAGKITPQWLTSALDAKVSDVSYEIIGTGKMGDNARLTLQYDDPSNQQSLVTSIVAKLPAEDPQAREMASSSGAYAREVLFYQHQAPLTSMRLPEIYHSAVSEDGSEFIILMQDMSPAEPGDQIIGETAARAELAVDEVAKLHAPFWGSKNLVGEHISRPSHADNAEFGGALIADAWPKFLERFSSGLNEEAKAFGDKFCSSYAKWITRFTGERTLIHSDFRSENILFVDDPTNPSATTVDWQSIGEGGALTDVAYFLGGSLPIEIRRQHEKSLVERYRNALSGQGIQLSAEDCWEQYREFAMGAFMTVILGAVYTAAAERSDKMFLTMAQRHFQQCVDLKSDDFIL